MVDVLGEKVIVNCAHNGGRERGGDLPCQRNRNYRSERYDNEYGQTVSISFIRSHFLHAHTFMYICVYTSVYVYLRTQHVG